MKATLWIENPKEKQDIEDRDVSFCIDDPYSISISISEVDGWGKTVEPHISIWNDGGDIFYGTAAQFSEWLKKLPKEINEG